MAKSKKAKKPKPTKTEEDLNAELDGLGPVAQYPAGRIQWWKDRCAIIDRHRKRTRISDVERAQERHSPTVEIAVDDPESTRKVRRNLTRVRQSEAWRHNQLNGMQRDAEKEMEFAWRQRTAEVKQAVSKYGERGGTDNRIDFGADVDKTWREWVSEAQRRDIVVDAVVDTFAEPKTLQQVERDHRMRRGQAMSNYVRGLDLWCELRGWMRRPAVYDGPVMEEASR